MNLSGRALARRQRSVAQLLEQLYEQAPWMRGSSPKLVKVILAHQTKYGKFGSRIPNSELVRSYCGTCGDPMRVTKEESSEPVCGRCVANRHPGWNSCSSGGDVTEPSPSLENAVGALEDGE